jgi:3-methyladenine DNA glycosylase/8-oxoguanine DNA glycosylase
MTPRRAFVLDLLVSMLAVAGWSADRVYALREQLSAEHLDDPAVLPGLSEEEIARRINRAGYVRGDYITGLMTERIRALAKALGAAGADQLLAWERNDQDALAAWLSTIKGVGPTVIRTFRVLRE